jgi:ATP-binding cassette, subfamily F, member 2
MSTKWHEKKSRIAETEFEKALWNAPDDTTKNVVTDGALGKGDVQVFERKMSKEDKKAAAKAKRDAKKKSKHPNDTTEVDQDEEGNQLSTAQLLQAVQNVQNEGSTTAGGAAAASMDDGSIDHDATDRLAAAGTICTFATNRKGVDARSRDINVLNFTLQHMGMVMLDETELVFNHGNRYGLVGRNGSGKSTLLKVIGARAIPVPSNIDLFLLDQEVAPSDTITAIEAVMSVDEERLRLEQQADDFNQYLGLLSDRMANQNDNNNNNNNNNDSDVLEENGKTLEETHEDIMEALTSVYERLDALDADTAEVRARFILKGLGFTHEMQGKFLQDFSGGWRMRVALARALFISPAFLVLDEPTAHLDMESVIWLEDRLSKYTGILLLVSHSQDFMNHVCTHTIHLMNKKKLQYYDGNYDQFVKTKREKDENQMKQYKWEQDQIKSMKEYVARFGHGTAKNAKQAQSKEKVLEKMIRGGLTDKPEEEKPLNFRFADPGKLVPPVLAFHDVSFGYPGCQPLYTNVNLGVDLDSRIALVGPVSSVW